MYVISLAEKEVKCLVLRLLEKILQYLILLADYKGSLPWL